MYKCTWWETREEIQMVAEPRQSLPASAVNRVQKPVHVIAESHLKYVNVPEAYKLEKIREV